MYEVTFGLTVMDWNDNSWFWIDWNGLDWRKLVLDRLECNDKEEVSFGLTLIDWNEISLF
jgi:hypothetical protein